MLKITREWHVYCFDISVNNALKPLILTTLLSLAISCAPARQQSPELLGEINSYGENNQARQDGFTDQTPTDFEERLRLLRLEEPAEEPIPASLEQQDLSFQRSDPAPETLQVEVRIEESETEVLVTSEAIETDIAVNTDPIHNRPAPAVDDEDLSPLPASSDLRPLQRPIGLAPDAEVEDDSTEIPAGALEEEEERVEAPVAAPQEEMAEDPQVAAPQLRAGEGLEGNNLRFAVLGESHTVSHFGDSLVEGLNELGEVHRFAVAGSSTYAWLSRDGRRIDIGYVRDSFDSEQNSIDSNRGEALLLSRNLLQRFIRSTNPNVVVIQLMDNQLFDLTESNIESTRQLVRLLKNYESRNHSRSCFYITTTHTTGDTSYPTVTNDLKRSFINEVLVPVLESENCELINSMQLMNENDVITTDGIHLDSGSGTLWGQRASARIADILSDNVSQAAVTVEEPEAPQPEDPAFEPRAAFVYNFEDPTSSLLLRSGPSRNSEVLGRLSLIQNNDGITEVLITGIANEDYFTVTYNGVDGYVGRDHITFDRAVAEAEVQEIIANRPSAPEPGELEDGKALSQLADIQTTCNQIKQRAQSGDFSQSRVNVEATYYVMPILPHINRDSRNHLNCINLQGKCIVRNGPASNDVVHNIRRGLYDYTTEDRTEMRCKFGYGNRSNCLDPCTTIAADQDQHPRGTVMYIPHMEGRICPQNNQPISGCFVVDDIGGEINGWGRFDFFQGECLNYDYATSTCLDENSADFIDGVNSQTLYTIPRDHELAEQLKNIREDHIDNSWNYSFP